MNRDQEYDESVSVFTGLLVGLLLSVLIVAALVLIAAAVLSLT